MQEKIFRHAMKAVIIKDNKLLAISCDYGKGRFSKLPGGGHEWGETMHEALIRECKEELGIDVKPLRMILARDYIAKNHDMKFDSSGFHMTDLIFECSADDFSTLGQGTQEDSDAQEIRWIDLDDLAKSDFYPKAIVPYLLSLDKITQTIVLGDIN